MTPATEDRTQLRQDVDRNVRWNLILLVAVVVLGILLISFEYYQFTRLIQPANIVSMAEAQIEANYPEYRAKLKERLIAAAPELAETISHRAVRSVSDAREELVQYLGRQMAIGLDDATAFSAEEFRAILRENRDLVEQAVEELKLFPEQAERFITDLEGRLEKRWDVDFRKEARFVVRALHGFNAKLDHLSSGRRLTPEDLLLRQIVRIVRAMQKEVTGNRGVPISTRAK